MSKVASESVNGGSTVLKDLVDFIGAAEKSSNYPPNTAAGMRAALKLVSKVLQDHEASSLETFRKNLDAIFQRTYNENRSRMTAGSLQTYRGRVQAALADYMQYGSSPEAMASWGRKVRVTRRSTSAGTKVKGDEASSSESAGQGGTSPSGPGLSRFEISIRPGVKALLWVPCDLSKAEASRIKAYVDASVVG